MRIKLAEALLRRKQLNQKVAQLHAFNQEKLFEIKVNRQKVSDNIDNVVASVPKVSFSSLTKEFDFYSKQLRIIDAAIQQANWTTELDVLDTMKDFEE